jgi:Endoribonuclease L-PSP
LYYARISDHPDNITAAPIISTELETMMPTRIARLVPALLVTLMGASTANGHLPPRLVDPMPPLNASAQPAPAAQRRVIAPPGRKPVGPYSPGIIAGDFLYVSGQGARDRDGRLPDTVEAQVRQTLDNLKGIVEAAGLTLEHVVYT